jgi:hypothetical protein
MEIQRMITGAILAAAGAMTLHALPIEEQIAVLDEEELVKAFAQTGSAEARKLIFERMMDEIPGAEYDLMPVIENKLPGIEKKYFELLRQHLPAGYRTHLAGLTDEQIRKIQHERRKWRPYIEVTSAREDFKTRYFDTAVECVNLTLPDLGKSLPKEAADARKEYEEFGDYLDRCRRELGEDEPAIDPTAGKRSPTGHPYPTLDRPRTPRENLDYLETSMVLALTLAPEGAVPVLMRNAEVAKEIDYEEGEFVLLANKIRMFAGSIAWAVDPLTCACARDHSNDRKLGLAQGHMSTVEGKHGMADRCRYWGTTARSEGAGGGTGASYLRGLSYSGVGHGGPLYGQGRNVIGIGMRGGAATSMYRTDKGIVHPCAVTEKESFMPPGLGRRDLSSPAMRSIYQALQKEDFAGARKQVGGTDPADPVERTILRFFKAAVEVEIEWRAGAIAAVSRAGDVYCARNYLEKSLKAFGTDPDAATRFGAAFELPDGLVGDEYEIGRKFHRLVDEAVGSENLAGDGRLLGRIRSFADGNPGSVYAKAAEHCLNGGGDPRPVLSYFLDQGGGLGDFGYPGGEF